MVCVESRVFSREKLILRSIMLVTIKEWLLLGNKLNYTHTKIGAKVQPHQPSVYQLTSDNVRLFSLPFDFVAVMKILASFSL